MMNGRPNRRFGTLHAFLQEVEHGLFSAGYRAKMNPDQAGMETFPDKHIGTSADGLKQCVEEMARPLGYDRDQWDAIETG